MFEIMPNGRPMKSMETRAHRQFESLVGQRIAIHVGKTWDKNFTAAAVIDYDRYARIYKGNLTEIFKHIENIIANPARGAVLGTVYAAAFRPLTPADAPAALCHAEGLYGLEISDPQPFPKPIPAKGALGVWNWENTEKDEG